MAFMREIASTEAPGTSVAKGVELTDGNLNEQLAASFMPSGQTAAVGVPRTVQILNI